MASNEFYKALSFTLYMGAARHDASPRQLEQLRDRVEVIKEFIKDGKYAKAKLVIREIMPEGWVPGPEWTLPRD